MASANLDRNGGGDLPRGRACSSSRWLLAPFYVGLVFALAMLLVVFVARSDRRHSADILHVDASRCILSVLTLIDLSLAANLVLIVIFSGYENFVSKINTDGSEDRPSSLDGSNVLDFSGLQDAPDRSPWCAISCDRSHCCVSFVGLTEAATPLDRAKAASGSDRPCPRDVSFSPGCDVRVLMDWLAGLTRRHAGALPEMRRDLRTATASPKRP